MGASPFGKIKERNEVRIMELLMAAGPLVRAVSEPAVLSGSSSGCPASSGGAEGTSSAWRIKPLHDVLPGAFVQLVDGNGGVFRKSACPDAGTSSLPLEALYYLAGNQLSVKPLRSNGRCSCRNDNRSGSGPSGQCLRGRGRPLSGSASFYSTTTWWNTSIHTRTSVPRSGLATFSSFCTIGATPPWSEENPR